MFHIKFLVPLPGFESWTVLPVAQVLFPARDVLI